MITLTDEELIEIAKLAVPIDSNKRIRKDVYGKETALSFLKYFNILKGRHKIKCREFWELYCLWAKSPKSEGWFHKELKNYLTSRKYNRFKFIEINMSKHNLTYLIQEDNDKKDKKKEE